MTLSKNEKPRSKPEKKKLKPVRAWAVVNSRGNLSIFNGRADIFRSLRRAKEDAAYGEGLVVRVLITEIE